MESKFVSFQIPNSCTGYFSQTPRDQMLPYFLLAPLFFLPFCSAFQTSSRAPVRCRRNWEYPPKYSSQRHLCSDGEHDDDGEGVYETTRRNSLRILAAGFLTGGSITTGAASPSWAGEVGARITKAVTTSDLGISVRTSVVKGAQVMDQIDGQWERFSDRFGLGSERSKQGKPPAAKVIPDPLPLNIGVAQQLLTISDQAFLLSTEGAIKSSLLEEKVAKVANLIRPSYERSGVVLNKDNPLQFSNGPQFNFAVYSHFKAYSDLIVEQKIPFAPFRSRFEQQIGQQLVGMLQPSFAPQLKKEPSTSSSSSSLSSSSSSSLEDNKEASLQKALAAVDDLCSVLRTNGLVALAEKSPIEDDKKYDWVDEVSDLEFTVALDGDITLNAQILLQEQGFRLYPNFARYAITYLMKSVVADQKVSAMDYYFDTDYNSDPDKFEVKEVLLSVTVES